MVLFSVSSDFGRKSLVGFPLANAVQVGSLTEIIVNAMGFDSSCRLVPEVGG